MHQTYGAVGARWLALATAAALTLSACSQGVNRGSPDSLAGDQTRAANSPPIPTLNFPTQGPNPGSMRLVPAFPNLPMVTRPTYLASAHDGTGRLFLVEQVGRIWVFDGQSTANSSRLFLDITDRVERAPSEEAGLLGLTFAPDYGSTGRFFVHYTGDAGYEIVISSFQVSAQNPDLADPSSEQVLISEYQLEPYHNGGTVEFGPDGMLYISIGDGRDFTVSQDETRLSGSILRIDPNSTTGLLPYGIPPDNPFVGKAGGVREELWAIGLRNPWRFSFDSRNGDLWCGDVGGGSREEIDLIRSGGNYGWALFEGIWPFRNPFGEPIGSYDAPVHDYYRDVGASVIGGYVYRGSRLSSLRGAYVFADFMSRSVFALVRDGQGVWQRQLLAQTTSYPLSFGVDDAGEIYLIQLDGSISQLEEMGGGGGSFPMLLSETGIFTDTANLVPQPGMLDYDVNASFWSDGADKQRWFGRPAHRSVAFSTRGNWRFAAGSVFVKHIELELRVGDPTSRHRLETRVFVREAEGWAGYSYRWNAAQTDAVLRNDERDSETFRIVDPAEPTGLRMQTWDYPSRRDCSSCHTGARGSVLGVRTPQLDRGQLSDWSTWDVFNAPIGDPTGFVQYPDPSDSSLPTHDRARAYLAVNCANCHMPGTPIQGNMDLRYRVGPRALNIVDVRPLHGDLGILDAYIVRRGNALQSVLPERMRRLDEFRMPAVGSHRVDTEGLQLLKTWINGLR